MQSFEATGLFWTPGNQDHAVAGALSFTHEDGLRLKLIGSFSGVEPLQDVPDVKQIFGVLKDCPHGSLVTGLHLLQLTKNISAPGFISETYHVHAAFFNAHLPDAEQRFDEATVHFTHLDDWVHVTGFNAQVEFDGNRMTSYRLTFNFPVRLTAGIDSGRISIGFAANAPMFAARTYNLRERPQFVIDLDRAVPFEEMWSRFIYPLQNLLTLVTDRPNGVTELTLRHSDIKIAGTEIPASIPVVFQPIFYEPASDRQLIVEHMLFALGDAPDLFEPVLLAWLRVSTELQSAYELFFGTLYARPVYLEFRFLALTQAIEAFHRALGEGFDLPTAEYERKVEQIVAAVPERERKWVAEKLQYANEKSLRRRLRELVTCVRLVLEPVLRGKANEFIGAVIDTRNWLVHRDERSRRTAASGEALHELIQRLVILLQALFLRQLGIPLDRTSQLFNRNQRYVQLRARTLQARATSGGSTAAPTRPPDDGATSSSADAQPT
jgi:hypothetical protein